MKMSIAIVVLMLGISLGVAAQNTKRVVLTPRSTMSSATVTQLLAHDCTGLTLTLDVNSADYALEAMEDTADTSTSFTLFNSSGDVISHGKHRSGLKKICKDIGRAK